MTTELVVRPRESTLQDIGEAMLAGDAGSVIISYDGLPAGIVTDSDLIEAATHRQEPLREIAVKTVMSHPLETIAGDRSMREALELMQDNGIRHLPVVEETTLVGMVTLSDIVYHYSKLRSEIHEVEQAAARQHWDSAEKDG